MRWILALAALAFATAVQAQTTTLVTPATYVAAIAHAQGGDTLAFAPGEYGAVSIKGKVFSPPLNLALGAAHFTQFVMVADGLNLTGGRFTASSANAGIYAASGSENIHISGAAIDDPTGTHVGIIIRGAQNVTVEATRISGVFVGVQLIDADDPILNHVSLTDFTRDGITGASFRRLKILNSDCTITTSTLSGHPDCVQLWTGLGDPIQAQDALIDNLTCTGQTQCADDFGGDRLRPVLGFVIKNSNAAISEPQAFALTKAIGGQVMNNHATTLPGAPFRASINVTAPGAVDCGNTAAAGAGKPAWASAKACAGM